MQDALATSASDAAASVARGLAALYAWVSTPAVPTPEERHRAARRAYAQSVLPRTMLDLTEMEAALKTGWLAPAPATVAWGNPAQPSAVTPGEGENVVILDPIACFGAVRDVSSEAIAKALERLAGTHHVTLLTYASVDETRTWLRKHRAVDAWLRQAAVPLVSVAPLAAALGRTHARVQAAQSTSGLQRGLRAQADSTARRAPDLGALHRAKDVTEEPVLGLAAAVAAWAVLHGRTLNAFSTVDGADPNRLRATSALWTEFGWHTLGGSSITLRDGANLFEVLNTHFQDPRSR